jgi:rhodanese-related sulfurtransferase
MKQSSRGKEISTDFISTQLRSRNPSFIISAVSLRDKLRKGEDIVLVDVRNNGDFERCRIPCSINIPLPAIKTKIFLKSKFLVLINEGYRYQALELESEKLKEHGFKQVRILGGGLNYWRDIGGPIEGDFFAMNNMNEVSPRDYFMDKHYDDWIAIDVSRAGGSNKLIPNAINISYLNNDDDFVVKLKRSLDEYQAGRLPYILIFNENGQQYKKIKRAIQTKQIKNVFYLKDGLEGYKAFLQAQTSGWHPHRRTVEKCMSCP